MKKILFSLMALVCSMSMNAQVMKVMKGNEVVDVYTGPDYEVVFEEAPVSEVDVENYNHVWVIGTGESVGTWNFANITQYLYDYENNGIYRGLIDYQWDAPEGWKITGIDGWSDEFNWGLDGAAEAPEEEASTLNLIADGGSADIKVYSNRFYMWEFDRNTLTLTKKYGFNTINVTGSHNSWNTSDPAMKMKYNATTHKFFLDVDMPAGAEFKFTCDENWNLNFGVDCEEGGANISAVAGKVRIYLDLNKNTYVFDAEKYGTEEEGVVWDPESSASYVGTWKVKSFQHTAETMQRDMWYDMITNWTGFPAQNDDDRITFTADGKIFTNLASTLRNYFQEESNYQVTNMEVGIHVGNGMENSVKPTILELDNVNRYFSDLETSEDKVAYLGVMPNADNEELLDVFIIDYDSRSFAYPDFIDWMMYQENKPTATAGGLYILFTMERVAE